MRKFVACLIGLVLILAFLVLYQPSPPRCISTVYAQNLSCDASCYFDKCIDEMGMNFSKECYNRTVTLYNITG